MKPTHTKPMQISINGEKSPYSGLNLHNLWPVKTNWQNEHLLC